MIGVALLFFLPQSGEIEDFLGNSASAFAPQDAASFFQWHTEQAANPAKSWDSQAFNAWVYMESGAFPDARHAIEGMEALRPGNADAQRFKIRLDSWNASLREGATVAARQWLAAHSSEPDSVRDSVKSNLAFLEREQDRRKKVLDSSLKSRASFWAALFLLASLGKVAVYLFFRWFPLEDVHDAGATGLID